MANHPGSFNRWFALLTVATCLTGFGIFQRGGFGDAHVLGIVTLLFIGSAAVLYWSDLAGNYKYYLEPCGLLVSFFLHFIPATVETFTRLPLNAPLFSGPKDPALEKIVAMLMLLLLAALIVQVWYIRNQQKTAVS